jgi:hypothetical protein
MISSNLNSDTFELNILLTWSILFFFLCIFKFMVKFPFQTTGQLCFYWRLIHFYQLLFVFIEEFWVLFSCCLLVVNFIKLLAKFFFSGFSIIYCLSFPIFFKEPNKTYHSNKLVIIRFVFLYLKRYKWLFHNYFYFFLSLNKICSLHWRTRQSY